MTEMQTHLNQLHLTPVSGPVTPRFQTAIVSPILPNGGAASAPAEVGGSRRRMGEHPCVAKEHPVELVGSAAPLEPAREPVDPTI
jgi:hypothetical protein